VTFQAAGDVEFQQHGADNRRRDLREAHQVVDRYGCRAEKFGDAGAISRAWFGRVWFGSVDGAVSS
jgi:hypothetical protein